MLGSPPDSGDGQEPTTALLAQLSQGNREVEARLIPQIYSDLRRAAARHLQRERPNHTLQPTALVNEAYARLVQQPGANWQSRAHFIAVASSIMRHILVDHARARLTGKRGGVQRQITLDDALASTEDRTVDVLALNEALERLALFDPRQNRIVEMHFFGGMSFEEIGSVLNISSRTAKRDWSMARAWLHGQLAGAHASE